MWSSCPRRHEREPPTKPNGSVLRRPCVRSSCSAPRSSRCVTPPTRGVLLDVAWCEIANPARRRQPRGAPRAHRTARGPNGRAHRRWPHSRLLHRRRQSSSGARGARQPHPQGRRPPRSRRPRRTRGGADAPAGGAAPTDAPAPQASGPMPSRDELTLAWADNVLASAQGHGEGVVRSGRFVSSEDDAAVLALPRRRTSRSARNGAKRWRPRSPHTSVDRSRFGWSSTRATQRPRPRLDRFRTRSSM